MAKRSIEYVPLDELKPALRNPKRHDLPSLKAALKRFGVIDVGAIDNRTGRIVSGHGRAEAYEQLAQAEEAGLEPPDGIEVAEDGRWLVPMVVGWSSRDDEDALAAGIALNRLTERGGWDVEDLAGLLGDLQHGPGIEGIGFEQTDIDRLLHQLDEAKKEPAPATPAEPIRPPENPVTKPGDVWLLGPHRLMCGDCRRAEDVTALLDGQQINLAFTSPPYADRRDYDEDSTFRPIHPDQYVEWFQAVAENVAAHLAEDGSWFVNIKPGAEGLDTHLYVLDLVLAHARQWGWHFATEFCWERTGVPKHVTQRFKNQFEPVYQFVKGHWKIRPAHVRHWSENAIVPLGADDGMRDWAGLQGTGAPLFTPEQTRKGAGGGEAASMQRSGAPLVPPDQVKKRRQGVGSSQNMAEVQGTNWAPGEATSGGWAYPGNRLPGFTSSHEATGHPAAFPVGLPEWFVKAYTDPGDRVYDPFCGSGSTILAAHQQERIGYGMEVSPAYCDVVAKRWETHTGVRPVLAASGEAVSFVAAPAEV